MTGFGEAAAVAAIAASAASAYTAYSGTKTQAKLGQHAENIRQEQLRTERQTAALQMREQEGERLRRAGVERERGIAGAAASGLDWWLSPSAQALDTENQRILSADISAIRLLGAAAQRKNLIEQRTSETTESAYGAMGANAWIAPTISLVGTAARTGLSMGPTGGGGGASPAAARPERATGRLAGPV